MECEKSCFLNRDTPGLAPEQKKNMKHGIKAKKGFEFDFFKKCVPDYMHGLISFQSMIS